ncbi:hypothetical protein BK659_12270 [Pseudomonas brassicacearum]|uniref:RHS repeat protein n=1 Tax=Pseudomonas brassicacearum TaxID=930166 RepID=A0A423H759_9PSED|nr:RHS repeat-associated core domain-containing protein [Pseudomonas brassicacearum]RON09016.1 hypothetical protein BK659_12270 [Pseudomonas brassicacearum]
MEPEYALHRNTPTLAVVDARGLAVASVAYYRKTSSDARPETRVTRQTFDVAGRSVANRDPRLGTGSTPIASMIRVPGLSGQPLLTVSVDAGWRLVLQDETGQVRQNWDGTGNTTRFDYDSMGRPLSIEQAPPKTAMQCVERFYYGSAESGVSVRNQCGRLIRHVDTAGAREVPDYSLQGEPLTESRRFLAELDHPGWPAAESQQDALLEQGADKIYSTCWQYDALGGVLAQLDAAGHTRRYAYSVQGQLQSTWLTVASKPEHLLASDMAYNAFGQIEREKAGNGVISSSVYDPADGRLRQLLASNGERSLQDLQYDYDPVGNIVCMTDESQPVSWFANQRVEPINRYGYDSLYQLISATGCEVASAVNGPALPELISPPDPARLQHYSQSWSYDAGGNLLEQRHSGKPMHRMLIEAGSNRGLTQVEGQEPDFGASFDDNGNLKVLAPGQAMRWTARNQLSEVLLVTRANGQHDSERYLYDGAGMRVRKVRHARAASVTRKAEVRYLPGLEIRSEGADSPDEVLHVLNVQAGRSGVRLLHWVHGQPDEVEEDQLRYSLDDHLGNSTLELDGRGNLISYEGYYAYGGTAWWMGRSQVEAKYKCVRYSGKERDATGLYYYGFRYYAPWLQRWINPDPAGIVDGLNVFCMVGNNPVGRRDVMGLYSGEGDVYEQETEQDFKIISRGRAQFETSHLEAFDQALLLTHKVLVESIVVLSSKDAQDEALRDVSEIYGRIAVSAEDMVSEFRKMRSLVSDYFKNGALSDQIVFVKAKDKDRKAIAFVQRHDDRRRLFLTPYFFATQKGIIPLVRTILHESSHMVSHTVDFYNHFEKRNEPAFLSDKYSVQELDKSLLRMGRSRTKDIFDVSMDITNGEISDDRLQSVFGNSDRQVIGFGVLKGGGVRDKMILNNADTKAVVALYVGRRALHNYVTSKQSTSSAH